MSTPRYLNQLLLFTVLLAFLTTEAYAFGAGDIPAFGYLSGKAFRHGDIENVLEEMSKGAGGAALSAGLINFAQSMMNKASGNKFTRNDIKRVYFGNWLRDYSQCMDIAGLSKLSAETLVLIVSVLGFMTFGYVTEEFEVTAERLGVYLPTEHIDNPKGYAQKEGDARDYHPKLRPPVDDRELEIDEKTGMKKYMATEGEEWDTSTALIRRVLRECIEKGRNSKGEDGPELFEAFRLLGTALHTLEDLMAHSNWCEIGLRRMGHSEVFCHVGDSVLIDTPNGRAPPLVTGTFGGADFLHSLLGEAGDKLSQASVTDLTAKLDNASQQDDANTDGLKKLLSKLPIGGDESDDKMAQSEQIHEQAKGYHFDPDNVAPPEVQQQLWDVLKWRDGIMRDISKKMEMIPGLAELLENLTNALNAYVYTLLAPYLTPILKQATSAIDEGSKEVIDNEDQYEVFDNPRASDPSHSLLSKDHFGLILNEPAGLIAQVIVQHSVKHVVEAWGSDSSADRAIDRVLEAFHHPYFATGDSEVQKAMFDKLEEWFNGLGDEGQKTIEALTKESVRDHKNKRFASEDITEPGYGGHSHGHGASTGASYETQQPSYGQEETSRYGQEEASRYGQEETSRHGGNDYDQDNSSHREQQSYGGGTDSYSGGGGYGSRREESEGHGEESQSGYGRQEKSGGYGGSGYRRSDDDQEERTSYENQESGYGGGSYGRQEESDGYGGGYRSEDRQEERSTYEQDSGHGGGSYGRTEESSYGRDEERTSGYGGNHGRDEDSHGGYGGSGYGHREESNQESSGYNPSYGSRREDESTGYGQHDNEYSGGSGRRDEDSEGYGQSSYGRRDDESSGYNPSYGQSERNEDGESGYSSGRREEYGDNNETYGAERLNLGDSEGRRQWNY